MSRRVEEKRSLITTLRERQKNWIGHILRGDSLLRDIIEGRMEGKRTRGRPRQMMLGGIRRTEGKSTAENRMASLEVGTCRRAEHLKKNIIRRVLSNFN